MIILKDAVDLPLLQRYDKNIKAWVIENSKIAFIEDNLPEQGEKGILYVIKNSIKYWNGIEYVDLTGTGGLGTWGRF